MRSSKHSSQMLAFVMLVFTMGLNQIVGAEIGNEQSTEFEVEEFKPKKQIEKKSLLSKSSFWEALGLRPL